MEAQEANALIAAKIAAAQLLVNECCEISDKSGVSFYIDFGGYGTGATYNPPLKEDEEDTWYSSGWISSSSNC